MSRRQPTTLATRRHFEQRARKQRPGNLKPTDVVTMAATIAAATNAAADAIDVIVRGLTFDNLVGGLEQECSQIVRLHGTHRRRLRSKAWYAAEILEAIHFVRASVARGDAQMAAVGALVAGVIAGGRGVQRKQAQTGAHARGQQISRKNLADIRNVGRYLYQYQTSDSLQIQYPSPTAFLKEKTGASEKTIRRRLKQLPK